MTSLKRLSINGALCYELPVTLAADTTIVLRRLSERRGDTPDETIRRALVVLNFVENEVAQGRKIIRTRTRTRVCTPVPAADGARPDTTAMNA